MQNAALCWQINGITHRLVDGVMLQDACCDFKVDKKAELTSDETLQFTLTLHKPRATWHKEKKKHKRIIKNKKEKKKKSRATWLAHKYQSIFESVIEANTKSATTTWKVETKQNLILIVTHLLNDIMWVWVVVVIAEIAAAEENGPEKVHASVLKSILDMYSFGVQLKIVSW